MNQKKVYKILTILLVMQWALIQIIAQFPNLIEKYYSNGIYIFISKFFRIIFGWIPFSIGDVLYFFIGVFLIKGFYSVIKSRKLSVKKTLLKVGAITSLIFFFFHLNWGINYLRQPLSKTLNFDKNSYTSTELEDFTKILILKTNEVHYSITNNDTLIVNNPFSKKQIRDNSKNAYKQLANKYPQFSFDTPSIKNSLFSIPLAYMGFAGYLNPITNEAQVNSLIPKNNYPATVCHEIAHQVGIASESEANFVGYMAAINSKDQYFNYAGYLMALRYCLYEVYRTNPSEFESLKPSINKGILKDMEQSQRFWKSYQNWSEKYFKWFYDSYLKANKQKDGIKGYNKMVSLLINYYKTEKL